MLSHVYVHLVVAHEPWTFRSIVAAAIILALVVAITSEVGTRRGSRATYRPPHRESR